ncbi:MAG: VanW family protein [Bacteroidota bacterium]
MNADPIPKPEHRGRIRKLFGKELFILKRRLHWLTSSEKFAHTIQSPQLPVSIFTHQSFLLRPLRDVDMLLQHNKVTNLRLAIAPIDGIVIKPGETFSLWKLVGRPTAAKGYLEGLTLENGKIAKGIGGGLCQLGNLLYWMILHSQLHISERWRHGYDVFPDINRTIPFGCGATLSYNYVDLKITNTTPFLFQIRLWLDAEYLHGELLCEQQNPYSYTIFETDHIIKQQWWGGYTRHNKIWKQRVHKDTGEQTEEMVTQNHAIMMYNPLLEK